MEEMMRELSDADAMIQKLLRTMPSLYIVEEDVFHYDVELHQAMYHAMYHAKRLP
jgi:hypothetical protein